MPLRIAVICATNRRNTGMLTVDLAAQQFFGRSGVDATFFRSHVPDGQSHTSFAGQQFTHYDDAEQLAGFDRVVFWGDFLNSLPYGRHNFARLDRRFGLAVPAAESFARWRSLFLLEGYRRPPSQRIISVSNNFQGVGDSAGDLPVPMVHRLRELYASNFDAIFPRDRQSLHELLAFAPDAAGGRVSEGLDAAFLLDPASLGLESSRHRPSSIRYFFGRSGFEGTTRLLFDAGLQTRRVPREVPNWLDVQPEWNGPAYLRRQFGRLQSASVVLTDTYHLCVNALNLGVPVVGIGKPADRQVTAAGDFKKSVLFDSLGLQDFYIARPQLDGNARKRIVGALRTAQMNGAEWRASAAVLAGARAAYRETLEQTIF